jgi:hypothetical protein
MFGDFVKIGVVANQEEISAREESERERKKDKSTTEKEGKKRKRDSPFEEVDREVVPELSASFRFLVIHLMNEREQEKETKEDKSENGKPENRERCMRGHTDRFAIVDALPEVLHVVAGVDRRIDFGLDDVAGPAY